MSFIYVLPTRQSMLYCCADFLANGEASLVVSSVFDMTRIAMVQEGGE